jgi:hypothetical protein
MEDTTFWNVTGDLGKEGPALGSFAVSCPGFIEVGFQNCFGQSGSSAAFPRGIVVNSSFMVRITITVRGAAILVLQVLLLIRMYLFQRKT